MVINHGSLDFLLAARVARPLMAITHVNCKKSFIFMSSLTNRTRPVWDAHGRPAGGGVAVAGSTHPLFCLIYLYYDWCLVDTLTQRKFLISRGFAIMQRPLRGYCQRFGRLLKTLPPAPPPPFPNHANPINAMEYHEKRWKWKMLWNTM